MLRKPRHRMVKVLAQGHTARKQRHWDSKPSPLPPGKRLGEWVRDGQSTGLWLFSWGQCTPFSLAPHLLLQAPLKCHGSRRGRARGKSQGKFRPLSVWLLPK